MIRNILPDGFFVIDHKATGKLVATAMAAAPRTRRCTPTAANSAGWPPTRSTRARGWAWPSAPPSPRRFIQAGYEEIYLRTDDFRLPALKVYLKLGYEPLLYADDMKGRWKAVCAKLGWPKP